MNYTSPYPTIAYQLPASSNSPYSISASVQGPCKVSRKEEVPATDPECYYLSSARLPTPGTALIDDTRVDPSEGFGNLAPGPGRVTIIMDIRQNVPATGFAAVRWTIGGTVSVPITWV